MNAVIANAATMLLAETEEDGSRRTGGSNGAEVSSTFFDEGIGAVIQNAFTYIGVVIVIIVVWKVIKAAVSGKVGDAVKVGVGGLLAAAVAFNLMLPVQFVQGLGNLVELFFDTLGSLTGDG